MKPSSDIYNAWFIKKKKRKKERTIMLVNSMKFNPHGPNCAMMSKIAQRCRS